jgi:hypothetical protein
MTEPSFLHFRIVPRRPRHDGWTATLQFNFIVLLARGLRPGEAAARLGMGRQSAYALRSHPGAEDFVGAWDEALAFARQVRIVRRSESALAPRPVPPNRDEHERHDKPDGAQWHVSASQALRPGCRRPAHPAKGPPC